MLSNIVSIKNFNDIYELEIKKKVKNKNKLLEFNRYKFEYFTYMREEILNNKYNGGKYNLFIIREPKKRLIMSQGIYDKVINHFVTRYILEVKLSKYLIDNNVATRLNKGLDYGIKLVKKMIERNKKYGTFYFLKIDIKKYFNSIDHGVLKSLLIDKLDNDEYELICKIIDSTNSKYISDYINKVDKSICYYEEGKSLPLGNLSSQFLAIFYLYKLHHYIIHNLHIKDMVVYMDDYILIHHDREYLKKCKEEIIKILKEYKLEVNMNKTYIVSSKEGVNFLGYKFKVIDNKTIIKISRSSKNNIKKRIKNIKYLYDHDFISFSKYFTSINVYKNSFKYSNNISINNIIDRVI